MALPQPPTLSLAASHAVLEMSDVSVSALNNSDRVVLRHVDWRVDAGDFWVVTGLHHSGKTDLMCLSAGLMPPFAGSCRIFGTPLEMTPERQALRLRLGLVFDGGQLLSHLTVAENIALPLRYHSSNPAPITDALTQVLLELAGLRDLAHRMPAGIGRNWRQRAGLARALALKPEVLLLDSPLTGLDPIDAGWWLELLSALAQGHPLLDQRPLTLIVTADDLRPWRHRANRFAVLQRERFVPIHSDSFCSVPDDTLMQHLLARTLPPP